MEFLRDFFDFIILQRQELLKQIQEHIYLTLVALFLALIIGVSLGIIATRRRKAAGPIITVVNFVQTIPSLALLGFLLPLMGIGEFPAITALFLYALLPIVRNTYAGIDEVDPAIREAAVGMGLTNLQILTKVELPLAVPVIFAGIRTAMVISIGVATLCALIAAGGLGEFIFRGIAVNNSYMILAGALPAALLALFFDFLLGILQKHIRKLIKPLLGVALVLMIVLVFQTIQFQSKDNFLAGFPSEFMEREDGWPGLRDYYNLPLETVELEIGLMYQALENNKVDLISGFSTDGRIVAYNLRSLEDDKNYFPPYDAAPLVSMRTMQNSPEVEQALRKLDGIISEQEMIELNYQVDEEKNGIREVAADFLQKEGFQTSTQRDQGPQIIIGSKNFTESFILAEMFGIIIENYTNYNAELKLGFGGTKLVFDALANGEIDLYPEYTGTGLLVILQPEDEVKRLYMNDKERLYAFVQDQFKEKYQLKWLDPLGFNNTHAMMMREEQAARLGIKTISDLSEYLQMQQ